MLEFTLKAGERIVVNGAVLVNRGQHPSKIGVANFASIIRERDIMLEEDADTPCKRLYFALQCLLLDASNAQAYLPDVVRRVEELRWVFRNEQVLDLLDRGLAEAQAGNHYKALSSVRSIIKYEKALLAKAKLDTLEASLA